MDISTSFLQLQEDGKFVDVSFDVGNGKIICCHKVVFASCSAYLKLLFSYDDRDTFAIPERQFEVLFQWTYCGKAVERGGFDSILEADFLGASTLLKHCTQRFISKMEGTSFHWLLQLTNFKTSLLPSLVDHLASNFEECYLTSVDNFCLLSFETLAKILESKSFYAPSETVLWAAIKHWVMHNLKDRRSHLMTLLKHLKLGLMPMSAFKKIRRELFLLLDQVNEEPLMERVYRYQVWKHGLGTDWRAKDLARKSINSHFYTPRVQKSCVMAVGGWSNGEPHRELMLYDHCVNHWYTLPVKMPYPRAYHEAVSLDCCLYVVGGYAGQERFKSMMCLELNTLEWRELPPMHKERCYVSAVALNGKVYCFGGHDGTADALRLISCEVFDPLTNQWSEIADMNEPRSDSAAVAFEGKIYLFGGFNGTDYLDTCEMYDTESGNWTRMPSMTSKRGGVCGVVFQNRIYALGGCDGNNRWTTVEWLDPKAEEPTWTSAPPMIQGRSNFGACSLPDRLVVAGGYINPVVTDQSEWFDGFHWQKGDDLPRSMSALVMTQCDIKPALAGVLEESGKHVVEAKRMKRIQAFNSIKDLNAEHSERCIDLDIFKFCNLLEDNNIFDNILQ